MTKFHDLDFKKLSDGSIRLTQDDRMDEASVIDMHPEQLLYMARQLCGMKPQTADKVKDLERRIAVLTDKLQNIVCNKAFRGDLIERSGDGFEYLAHWDALLDLALEFDGGRLEPEYKDDEQPEATRTSKSICPPSAIAEAEKAQPNSIAEAGTGNLNQAPVAAYGKQLGLAV